MKISLAKNVKTEKMDAVSYKTISANEKIVKKEWVVVDAQEMVVGRLATQVARILKGKNKPYYTPHFDCGDNVIIINAEKVKFTGHKWTDKQYVHHTTYPGGQRFTSAREMMLKSQRRGLKSGMHPLFLQVIKGMLPKNRLGAKLLRNVHIYNGSEHPHEAQQPKVIDINKLK